MASTDAVRRTRPYGTTWNALARGVRASATEWPTWGALSVLAIPIPTALGQSLCFEPQQLIQRGSQTDSIASDNIDLATSASNATTAVRIRWAP